MTQTIMFPTLCFGCKAPRTGLTESIALYGCGTAVGVQDGRVKARRTQKCIDRQEEKNANRNAATEQRA